jgi:hypothetical protein
MRLTLKGIIIWGRLRNVQHRREDSIISTDSRHRVHRAPNNVTYVQLETGDDPLAGVDISQQETIPMSKTTTSRNPSSMPYCPPPDYPGASTTEGGMMLIRKNSSNNSATSYTANNQAEAINKRITQRTGSERLPMTSGRNQPPQKQPLARPLYSHDETTIIRRF